MLKLTEQVRRAIAAHAESTYPDECVGLLLGTIDGAEKLAVAALAVENRWEGQLALAENDNPHSRRDRFYLDPRDYLRADRAAREQGLDLIGCYHSHPDHVAVPSERDRIGAQGIGGSNFSFLIQAVRDGQAAELSCWLLSAGGDRFVAEELLDAPPG